MKALAHDVAEGKRFTFRLEALSERRVHVVLTGGPHGCRTHLVADGYLEKATTKPHEWLGGMVVTHANGRRAARATKLEVEEDAKVALASWLGGTHATYLLSLAGKEARRREVAMAEHAVADARVSLANARKRLAKATLEVARG